MSEEHEIKFLHFEEGVWERLEIDGKRVFNNHSLEIWDLLDYLEKYDLLKDNVNLEINMSYNPEKQEVE